MRFVAFIAAAALFAGAALYWITRAPHLPQASEQGTGPEVALVLFSDRGERLQMISVRQIVHTEQEWRRQLTSEQFDVARRKATEPPFHNLYWNEHAKGVYRCVCCGNAVFRSQEKFDSDTGWPSFWTPIAAENISFAKDNMLREERTEVLCRKCGAHLGHVFEDGPPPTGKRYCLNSAALYLVRR